jgi:hypothetical protein
MITLEELEQLHNKIDKYEQLVREIWSFCYNIVKMGELDDTALIIKEMIDKELG